MGKFLSLDIGGTNIKFGVLDEKEEFLKKGEFPTEALCGGSFLVKKIKNLIFDVQTQFDLKGICISTAGMVDPDRGTVIYASDLIPNYTGTKWKEMLEEQFHLPCEVENDVNCAGLAESISGSGKESQYNLCLTVGTGIGGCFVKDQEIYHGSQNSALEVGYMKMFDSDFQTLGATSTLVKKVVQRKNEPARIWDGKKIFEAAKQGDEICQHAILELATVLGRGIANICYVLNPETIILGGGIMAQKEYLEPLIQQALKENLLNNLFAKTKLTFANYQNDAGMLGAFYHFKQAQKSLFQ